MNDDDVVLARYEVELASEHVTRALTIKLSWQPMPTGIAPHTLEHLPFPLGPNE